MRRLLLAAAVLLPGIAVAQTAEVSTGLRMAQTWCSGCHQIAPGQPIKDAVPAFVQIARRPDTTADTLRGFLRKPHGRMPDFSLTEANIGPLVAYILSLR